jgi:hypothetical protein
MNTDQWDGNVTKQLILICLGQNFFKRHKIKMILGHPSASYPENFSPTHKIKLVFVKSAPESNIVLGNHKSLKDISTSLPNLILKQRNQSFTNSCMNFPTL